MAESENTILHTHVLAELFKDTYLVDLATNPADAMESARSTSNIKKEVLVCVATNEENLPPSKEALLQAILSACKLNMGQVGIITNQLQIQNDFLSLVETHQAKKIILFGWDPAAIGLPIHFPVFQIQSFQGVQYLHAPTLDELDKDKQLKIQLWQKLKQIFPS
jgi:DNA polymerase III psi subunit